MRFGPPVHSNPLGELITLRQTDTMEEYVEKFQALLARTDSVLLEHQVDILIVGLTDKLRLDVQLAKPHDLEEAMSLTRAYEQRLWLDKSLEPSCTTTRGNSTPTHALVPSQVSPKVAPTFIKRLSRAKMAKQRSKSLCYNCDEQFTPGHNYKDLFWLEVMGIDEKLQWR